MSSIYIQEPPTEGKVVLRCTVGDIEVELWSRECPRAARNFVQLCMEGYYDKTKFHRVVPGFVVQGGDPTGTGAGGESAYGRPFRDEFHSRLRFVRRGLVGMANAGGKDDNGSQFFFTMGPAQELQNKHTLFGKVVGDTIYNMVKLQEGEIGDNDRPAYPHKILSTEVLANPFPDIEPRKAIRMIVEDDDSTKSKKPRSRMRAAKDFKLLSFGDEAEDDADDLEAKSKAFADKPKSSHDLLDDPTLSKEVATVDNRAVPECPSPIRTDRLDSLREKLKRPAGATSKAVAEAPTTADEKADDKRRREDIQREIRALKKEVFSQPAMADKKAGKADRPAAKKEDKADESNDLLMDYHRNQEEYRAKARAPKKGSAREDATMAMLNKFKSKLSSVKEEANNDAKDNDDDNDDDEISGDDWMANTLKFASDDPVLAKDASTKDDDWFDIYDPRNPVNKRRRDGQSSKKRAK